MSNTCESSLILATSVSLQYLEDFFISYTLFINGLMMPPKKILSIGLTIIPIFFSLSYLFFFC